MLEEWTHLPRWFRVASATIALGYSGNRTSQGVLSPWGFGVGALLSCMAPGSPFHFKSQSPFFNRLRTHFHFQNPGSVRITADSGGSHAGEFYSTYR